MTRLATMENTCEFWLLMGIDSHAATGEYIPIRDRCMDISKMTYSEQIQVRKPYFAIPLVGLIRGQQTGMLQEQN